MLVDFMTRLCNVIDIAYPMQCVFLTDAWPARPSLVTRLTLHSSFGLFITLESGHPAIDTHFRACVECICCLGLNVWLHYRFLGYGAAVSLPNPPTERVSLVTPPWEKRTALDMPITLQSLVIKSTNMHMVDLYFSFHLGTGNLYITSSFINLVHWPSKLFSRMVIHQIDLGYF